MDDLKQRIEQSLRRVCAPDATPFITLRKLGGRLGGRVVSPRFASLEGADRQDLIWDQLDEALTRAERARVGYIFASTPEEHEQLLRDVRRAPKTKTGNTRTARPRRSPPVEAPARHRRGKSPAPRQARG